MRYFCALIPIAAAMLLCGGCNNSASSSAPYKLANSVKVGGEGGFDYVYADSDGRHLFIPRGDRVTVFDLDSLKPVGVIPGTNKVHGVAVDPMTGHGFASSNPVVMFDTKTLAAIKNIEVEGGPDGIFFDPGTSHVFVLSHSKPNVTVLNSADGSIAGTIDVDGAPEQACSDGDGHIFIDVEDGNNVAVVDAKTLKVTAHYALGDKGGTPAGLAIDAKNHVLFAFCRNPQNVVIMNSEDGKIIATLPIGNGVDAAEFNPATMEAFSSQRDGTLTVIKENNPTSFVVEQNVQTKVGAKTSTLDTKTNQIYLITAEYPATTQPATTAPGARPARPQALPNSFMILVVGK